MRPPKTASEQRRRASPWFDGVGAWMLHQYMGFVWAFGLAVVIVPPLVVFGVLDRDALVLPAALAFPAAVTLGIAFARRRLGGRKP